MCFGDAAKRYTAVLHAHGKSAKAEPESFTSAEIESTPFVRRMRLPHTGTFLTASQLYFLGTDVRITADRAREIGWKPVHGIAEFLESIQEDAEAVLAGEA